MWPARRATIIFFFLSINAYAGDARMLCHQDEDVLFSCDLEKKVAAVCASHGVTSTSGYIQYRFGALEKLEFVYPSQLLPPKGKFFYSHTLYGGGDGNHIRFENEGHEYFLFSKRVRTTFNPGEPNDPEESAGIYTRLQGKLSKARKCWDFDAIHGKGIDAMDGEEYSDDFP